MWFHEYSFGTGVPGTLVLVCEVSYMQVSVEMKPI